MKGRDGHAHVSRWPPGWRSDRRRVPTILTMVDGQWTIVDPDGHAWTVTCHAKVLAVAAHPYPEEKTKPRHLDVFVSLLPHYPWLKEAMRDEHTTAYARGGKRIGGLICRHGRLKVRIEEAAAWGAEDADLSFLRNLTCLYSMLGEGAYPTPGGLGLSAMESSYLQAGYQRQSRPSIALRAALIAHRIGGRSDWVEDRQVYEQVWEADKRNAYLSAAALPLPVGSVTRFLEGEVTVADNRYRTWFGECTLFQARVQTNAPVLERLPSGRLCPFTRQGSITAWLWKKEAEVFAQRPGCYVIVKHGWAWTKMEPVLKPWAVRMHAVRAETATFSPKLSDMVKLVITAAIGRHGCRPEQRSVIPLRQAQDGDVVLSDTLDGQWAQHNEPDSDAPWLTHIHAYIEMTIRLENYDLQIAETDRHNLVLASNIDAVYFLSKPSIEHQPDVLGGWRVRNKHNVHFPYIRGLVSDEKVALPGLERGSKKREEVTHALR